MKCTGKHFFVLPLMLVAASCAAQSAQTAASPAPAAPQTTTASAIMQQPLSDVGNALDGLRPEKWKLTGAMKQETASNVSSIQHDLTNTLPPLLATADRTPDSVVAVLPAYRNIEALYDVLLRVTEIGRMSAPADQGAALNRALTSLENGRRALGERMQTAAAAREQRVHVLEANARAAAAAPKPVAVPCPTVTHTATTRRRTHRKSTKSTTKPAASSTKASSTNSQTGSQGSQSGTASH
ncbi:hypothetical protein GCM10011507_29360 [Edaphobacter acidisoli]|uniref:Uncharacterized protein n=1 Tax=Edaphobacter acidisoli TaxID=2040573 RepID=A0A916RY67_9BACT|nr:hypothetical protein [Edaphobacter acidisoli]GGA76093.1 hypothetical protein GCM10011507_29360 [Edaphobacter acidisoli]